QGNDEDVDKAGELLVNLAAHGLMRNMYTALRAFKCCKPAKKSADYGRDQKLKHRYDDDGAPRTRGQRPRPLPCRLGLQTFQQHYRRVEGIADRDHYTGNYK